MTYRQILIKQEQAMVEMLRHQWVGFWSERQRFHASLHALRRIISNTL